LVALNAGSRWGKAGGGEDGGKEGWGMHVDVCLDCWAMCLNNWIVGGWLKLIWREFYARGWGCFAVIGRCECWWEIEVSESEAVYIFTVDP
jgi:hypothetical protein